MELYPIHTNTLSLTLYTFIVGLHGSNNGDGLVKVMVFSAGVSVKELVFFQPFNA